MKKAVTHNRYYADFDDFRAALIKYLEDKSTRRKEEYARLMTEKFHLFSQSNLSKIRENKLSETGHLAHVYSKALGLSFTSSPNSL